MDVADAALVEAGGELVLGETRPPRRGDGTHIDQQLDAGILQFIEHGFRWRLLVTDGEELRRFSGHVSIPVIDE
jgi:hypothetical protein